MANSSTISIHTRVISWVLLLPLLVLAAQGGLSFEQGSKNTISGFAAAGIVSPLNPDESFLIKIQRLTVYSICAMVMLPLVRSIAEELRRNKMILGLCLFAFVSAVWSQNPKASIVSAILLMSDIAFSVYLLRRFPGSDLQKLMIMLGASVAAATLFLVFAFPEYGLQGRTLDGFGAWQGMFEHKNICGSVLTLLLLPAFFVETKSRYECLMRWIYGCTLLLLVAMTRSAGAWIVCGTCIGFIAVLKVFARLSRRTATTLALVIAGIMICVGYLGLQYFGSLMRLLGKDPTMTGRTVIWGLLIPSILKHPYFGYGYMAFWQGGLKGESANIALIMNWPGISYSENGIIDLLLGLGAIAVVMFLWIFGRAVKDAIYCFNRAPSSRVMWYISMLFFVAVSNIAAGQILYPSNLGCILQIVTFVGLAQERRLLQESSMIRNDGRMWDKQNSIQTFQNLQLPS